VNWFRRRQQAEDDDGIFDDLMFESSNWVNTLPDDAQLCVYEKGRYVGRFSIRYRGGCSLESMLHQLYGAGDYTVMPYFDGRLHSGHRFPIGRHSEREARRRLNESNAAYSKLTQNEGRLALLGLAGQVYVACDAIDNNVRLDDPQAVAVVQTINAVTELLEAAESAKPDAPEDTGAAESREGAAQTDDMQT
jgi:cell division protein ZapA (FtsZ GTPase activity inhibitor)